MRNGVTDDKCCCCRLLLYSTMDCDLLTYNNNNSKLVDISQNSTTFVHIHYELYMFDCTHTHTNKCVHTYTRAQINIQLVNIQTFTVGLSDSEK